jgi:hypothetical protein
MALTPPRRGGLQWSRAVRGRELCLGAEPTNVAHLAPDPGRDQTPGPTQLGRSRPGVLDHAAGRLLQQPAGDPALANTNAPVQRSPLAEPPHRGPTAHLPAYMTRHVRRPLPWASHGCLYVETLRKPRHFDVLICLVSVYSSHGSGLWPERRLERLFGQPRASSEGHGNRNNAREQMDHPGYV